MPNVSVTATGPFFNNPGKAVRDSIQEMKEKVALKGVQRLKEILVRGATYQADSDSTGAYNAAIQAELISSEEVLITDGGMVYGSWLEGTSSRNVTTRFKGYARFRQTTDWLNSGEAGEVMDSEARKLVNELN